VENVVNTFLSKGNKQQHLCITETQNQTQDAKNTNMVGDMRWEGTH